LIDQWRIQDFANGGGVVEGIRFRQGHKKAEGVEGWGNLPPKYENFCWKRYISL